jgi:transposase-like protein
MKRKGTAMWRGHYSDEVREKVLQEVMLGRESLSAVARRYGINKGAVWHWKKQREKELGPQADEGSRAKDLRIADLERMVGKLMMENDFLKKFAGYIKQQRNERSSIVTAKTWGVSKPDASSWDLPAARTTTGGETDLATPLTSCDLRSG